MAKRDATRNHNNVTWGIAGLGSCVTGIFAAGIGAGVAGFPGFLLRRIWWIIFTIQFCR